VDIGRPKRIHEIRPASVPVPEPAMPAQPVAPEPQPAEPVPAPTGSED
jgi:hypothetical protein